MEKEILEKIEELLEQHDEAAIRKELLNLNPNEIAKIINRAQRGKRKLFILLPPEIQAEVSLNLSRKTKKTVFHRISNFTVARFLHFVNDDSDIVDILQIFSLSRQKEILEKLHQGRRQFIEKLLKYDPNTAGGLMDSNFIIVNQNLSFDEVRRGMEEYEKTYKQIPSVVFENDNKKITGYIPIQKLIFPPSTSSAKIDIGKLKRSLTLVIDTENDTEIIKNIESGEQILGVINAENDFLGIIKIEDLAKVSLRETTENIYGFAGVKKEEDIFDSAFISISLRSRWLLVNLITAFLAAAVVSVFEDTISKFVLLAAYMPVVAGMGGNAGTQTLAVTVRGIALGDITLQNSFSILKKEILTSIGNGFIVGLAASGIAIFLNSNPMLGAVLFSALVINLIIAGFFGAIIPLLLKFFKIDPALAASVFVTTATDIFGFFIFLGLAEIFLV